MIQTITVIQFGEFGNELSVMPSRPKMITHYDINFIWYNTIRHNTQSLTWIEKLTMWLA